MAREFYVSRDGQEQHGPHTGIELREMADRGELRPTDMIWKEGMPKPVTAREVKGLFNVARSPSAAHKDKSRQIPTAANPSSPISDSGIDLKARNPSNGVGDTPQGHRDSPPYRPTSTTGYRTPTTQTEPTATETGGSEVTVRASSPFSTIKPTVIATGLLLIFCFIAFAVYVVQARRASETLQAAIKAEDELQRKKEQAEQTAQEKKRKAEAEAVRLQSEYQARLDQEQRENAARAILENATVLGQVQGKGLEVGYAAQFEKWAKDEFALHDAQDRIYQALFTQTNFRKDPEIGETTGCNLILSPGKYDFATHIYSLTLYLFYFRLDRSGTVSFSVVASFHIKQESARALRNAFDKGTLRLRVWFRLRSVLSSTTDIHGHESVVFEIDTIKVVIE